MPVIRGGNVPKIVAFLREYGKTMPKEIEKLIYINEKGIGYYHTGEVFNLSDRAYFNSILVDRSADYVITNPFISKSTERLIIAIVGAVKNEANATKGAIFISINSNELGLKAERTWKTRDAIGLFADNSGRVFIDRGDGAINTKMTFRNSPDYGYKGLAERNNDILNADRGGYVFYRDASGENRALFHSPIVGSPGWIYGISLRKSYLDKDTGILLGASIVAAVCSFMAAFFANLSPRRIRAATRRNYKISAK
jgi:hypothetical protein